MNLLKNIAWSFKSTDYPTGEDFNRAVTAYNERIMKERAAWNPDEVVVNSPVVEIAYEYWVTENMPLFEDEEAQDEEDDDEQRETVARFTAENGQYFTALDLLYKINQRLKHRELGDHIFFEGLTSFGGSEKNDPPLFYVSCGS